MVKKNINLFITLNYTSIETKRITVSCKFHTGLAIITDKPYEKVINKKNIFQQHLTQLFYERSLIFPLIDFGNAVLKEVFV